MELGVGARMLFVQRRHDPAGDGAGLGGASGAVDPEPRVGIPGL